MLMNKIQLTTPLLFLLMQLANVWTAATNMLQNNNEMNETLITIHQNQYETFISFIKQDLCDHIYLDMGTNVGIQLRKLYEPQYFPKSPIRWHFDIMFKEHSRKRICSLGFESNSLHTPRLLQIQKAYQNVNYPCVIFTGTAVNTFNGVVAYYRQHQTRDNEYYHEAGSSTLKYWGTNETLKENAISIDINKLVHRIHGVWRQTRSYNSQTSMLIAKVDIEGAEFEVLPHMLGHGSLCLFNEMILEWHERFFKNATWEYTDTKKMINWAVQHTRGCKLSMIDVDDNTYADGPDRNPLPSSGI